MARDLVSLVTTALQRCGQNQDNTDLYDQIIAEVPNVQVEMEDVSDPPRPWFLKVLASQDVAFLVTAGSSVMALPTGFLAEVDDAALYYISIDPTSGAQTKTPVEKLPYDVVQERLNLNQSCNTTGKPSAYVLDKNQIIFDVALDADTQFEWSYYARDAELTLTNKTNLWTQYGYNYLLWRVAELVAFAYLQDDAMAKKHNVMATRSYGIFRGSVIERDLAGTELHMGEDQ